MLRSGLAVSKRPLGYALALAAMQLALADAVLAEPLVDPQLVKAPAGRLLAVSLPDPAVLPDGGIVVGARLDHARRPLRLRCLEVGECPPGSPAVGTAVHSLSTAELSLAVGLHDAVELGAVLGVGLVRAARSESQWRDPSWAVGPTDARFTLKAALLEGSLTLAALLLGSVPSGAGGDYLGARGPTGGAGLVAAASLGALRAVSLLSYHVMPARTFGGLEVDDELRAAIGLDATVADGVGLLLQTGLRAGLGGETTDADEQPVESQLGVRVDLARDLRLRIAAATGVWPAPDGYGTSDYRVSLDLRASPAATTCALGPEDHDGFRDGDRCADPDNDGDGLLDGDDACPNDAEDRDGFADDDGCPDVDNDADTLPDVVDRCPEQSEDRDGHDDEDGCPEPDNDLDGLPDVDDRCPMDPEDRDGYQDGDGCPEPGPGRVAVTVTDTRILVSDRVYFEHDSEVIRAVSMPVLDDVARAILSLGPHRTIRVEGHTDAVGDAQYNLDLSFRRAKSVLEYLVSRGVDRGRISHVGFGGSRPLAQGGSPEARALNRRVEFAISGDSAPGRLENAENSSD